MRNQFLTTLPVGICIYALKNRKINQIKLYVYLKKIASGHIKYNNTFYDHKKEWAKDLKCHPKTIKSSLDWLIKNKWITLNNIKKSIRVVSYKQVCFKNNINTNRAAIYESDCFKDFKTFCIAVAMIHFRNRKKWNDKRSASNKRKPDASKSRYAFPKGFYPLPVLYFAKCLGVSKTTAHNMKKQAIKTCYIIRKKQHSFIYSGNNKLKKEVKDAYAKGSLDDDIVRRLRKGKKYLKIVDSDLIKSETIFKTKRLKFNKKYMEKK